jgi:hypothetical protein
MTWIDSYLKAWSKSVKIILCWMVIGIAIFSGGMAANGLPLHALFASIVDAFLLYLAIEL